MKSSLRSGERTGEHEVEAGVEHEMFRGTSQVFVDISEKLMEKRGTLDNNDKWLEGNSGSVYVCSTKAD